MNTATANVSNRTRLIVVTGLMLALTFVLTFTPIGFIMVPPVSITIMHLPVIIAGIIAGPISGLITGIGMGVASIIRAMTSVSPVDKLFLNPLISVLPRMLIGVAAHYAYVYIRQLMAGKGEKAAGNVSAIGASIAGTLTNTVGVLGMLYIVYGRKVLDLGGTELPVKAIVAGAVSINILVEVLAAIVICTPVVLAVKAAYRN